MRTITFCINTARNELDYIKLLFKSLRENLSTLEHEIIVFIDSDNQNTFDWLILQKSIFPNLKILKNNLPICYGYARNINEMFKSASNEIVSYLQSDMVICKDYDLEILKNLESNMILCSTRIEPPLHGISIEVISNNLGLTPTEFKFDEFIKFSNENKQEKITEYFFAPFTLYKDVWNSIGGHDTRFRRSREDSDILTRLVLNNTKIVQIWNALVYHFTCTSSRGLDWFNKNNTKAQERAQTQQIADRIELIRFFKKWGQFNHGLEKIKKYNVSAIIHGNIDFNKLLSFEMFFQKIYVDSSDIINNLESIYQHAHIPANNLLNISIEDWNKYSYMYNTLNASDDYFMYNSNIDDDITVEFDIESIDNDHMASFISKIQNIIDSVEETGLYEFGPFKINIKRKIDRAHELIRVSNPVIKQEHLYTIH